MLIIIFDITLESVRKLNVPDCWTADLNPEACAFYVIPTRLTFTCSKSTIKTLEKGVKYVKKAIKTPERCHWRCSAVFIVNFEHISHIFSNFSIVDFEQVNVSCEVAGVTC